MFEHHGDYQCTGVPDGPDTTNSAGMDCLTESIPDGYGKLITFPLGLEGDINDARAPNSTVLEWYYQLAARWVPKLECSEYPQPADDDDSKGEPAVVIDNQPPASADGKEQRQLKEKVKRAVFPRPKAMSFHNYAGPGDLNMKQ